MKKGKAGREARASEVLMCEDGGARAFGDWVGDCLLGRELWLWVVLSSCDELEVCF